MKDDFNNNLFELFDFNKTYIGIVLDNNDFLINNTVKIYIPELFGSLPDDNIEAYDFDENISLTKLEKFDNLIISDKINKSNYIECYPEVNNGDIKYIGDFESKYKPNVKDIVKVSFKNGNPLEPYYINKRIIKENEILDLKDGSSYRKIIEGEYYSKDDLNQGDLILDRTNDDYRLDNKNKYQLILTESGNFKKNKPIPFPTPPEIEGYIFKRWDPDISIVNNTLYKQLELQGKLDEGITFNPIYEKKKFKIVFLDIDNRILKEVEANYGDNLNNLQIPDPGLGRKVFTGWDTDISYITENLKCIPIFEVPVFIIKFKDSLGNTISNKKYRKGEEIIYPKIPNEINDYIFDKWDMNIKLALSDIIITAIYKRNTLPIIIKDKDGNVLKKFKNDSIIPLLSGSGNSNIWNTQVEPTGENVNENDLWLYDIASLEDLEGI